MEEFDIGLRGRAGAGLADAAEDIIAGHGRCGVERQAALAQAQLCHGWTGRQEEHQQGGKGLHLRSHVAEPVGQNQRREYIFGLLMR